MGERKEEKGSSWKADYRPDQTRNRSKMQKLEANERTAKVAFRRRLARSIARTGRDSARPPPSRRYRSLARADKVS